MHPPSDDETLELMQKHGDPVDHTKRYGWFYQFCVSDLQGLIADWLQRQARRVKRKKKQLDNQRDFFL